MKRWAFIICLFILSSCVIFCAVREARACTCDLPTVCQAYSRADAVFTGKLIKVVDSPEVSYYVLATFEVDKIFKGKVGKIETVRFRGGDCGPKLIVGEGHFVYKDPSDRTSVCNLSTPLSKTVTDLEYAEGLSKKEPAFKIWGHVNLDTAKVTITKDAAGREVPLSRQGFFEFSTKEEGEYVVRIDFSDEKRIYMKFLGFELPSTCSFLEYKVRFKPNECDYREIQVEEPEKMKP